MGVEGIQQCVWDVVVLAAISAMEHGRRFMEATRKKDPTILPGPILMESAISQVVADLWSRLKGFAALGLPRKGWNAVGPRHPFLRVVSDKLICARQERPQTDQ